MMKIKSRIVTKRRPRHFCEHLTDAQLAHIQYYENVKSAWETLCSVHEAKTIGNKFLRRRFFTIKMQEGEDLLTHINMVKALADQLQSIEVNIEDEDVYMVLLMNLPPSFDGHEFGVHVNQGC